MNNLELPNLQRWLAGDQPDAEMFNQLQDAMEFVLAPPHIRLIRDAAHPTLTYNTYSSIQWDKVIMDSCASLGSPMWTSTYPSRIYFQVPGWYEVMPHVPLSTSTDGSRRAFVITRNNNDPSTLADCRHDACTYGTGGNFVSKPFRFPVYMNKGEYIEIEVWNDAAANISVYVGSTLRPQLDVRWVSL